MARRKSTDSQSKDSNETESKRRRKAPSRDKSRRATLFSKSKSNPFRGMAGLLAPEQVVVLSAVAPRAWEPAALSAWNAQYLQAMCRRKCIWDEQRRQQCLRDGKQPRPTSQNPTKFLTQWAGAAFHVYQDLGERTFGTDQKKPTKVRVAFKRPPSSHQTVEDFACAMGSSDLHLNWRTNRMVFQRLVFDVDADHNLFDDEAVAGPNADDAAVRQVLATEAFCVHRFAPPCIRVLTAALRGCAVAIAQSGAVDAAPVEGITADDWVVEWTPSRKHKVSVHLYLAPRFVLQTDQLRYLFRSLPFAAALQREEAFLALFREAARKVVPTKVFDPAPLNGSMFRCAAQTKFEPDPSKQQYPPRFFRGGTLNAVPTAEALRWTALPDLSRATHCLAAHPDHASTVWAPTSQEYDITAEAAPDPELATRDGETQLECDALQHVHRQYAAWLRLPPSACKARFAIACGDRDASEPEADDDDAGEGDPDDGVRRRSGPGDGDEEEDDDDDDDGGTYKYESLSRLSFVLVRGVEVDDGMARRLCSPGGPFAPQGRALTRLDFDPEAVERRRKEEEQGAGRSAGSEPVDNSRLECLLRHARDAPGGLLHLCPDCTCTKGRRTHVFTYDSRDGSVWVKCPQRQPLREALLRRGTNHCQRHDYQTKLRPYPHWPGFPTPLAQRVADYVYEQTQRIPINGTACAADQPLVAATLVGRVVAALREREAVATCADTFGLFVDTGTQQIASAARVLEPQLHPIGPGWVLQSRSDDELSSVAKALSAVVDGRLLLQADDHSTFDKGRAAHLVATFPRPLLVDMLSLWHGKLSLHADPAAFALPRVRRLCPFPVVGPGGAIQWARGHCPGTDRVCLGFVPPATRDEAARGPAATATLQGVRAAIKTCNLAPPPEDANDIDAYGDRIASWVLLIAFCVHGRHLLTSNIPMTLISALSSNSGKTAFAKFVMTLCDRGTEPNMITWRDSEEKLKEELISLMRTSASAVALIDNVKDRAAIDSAFMEALLTGNAMAYRAFFTQSLIRAVLDIALFMTVNDVELRNPAMFRRSVFVQLGFFEQNHHAGTQEGGFVGRADALKVPLAQLFAHLWQDLVRTTPEERAALVREEGLPTMFSQGALSFDVARAYLHRVLRGGGRASASGGDEPPPLAPWYTDAPSAQMAAFIEALIEKDPLCQLLGLFFAAVARLPALAAAGGGRARQRILAGPWRFVELCEHVREVAKLASPEATAVCDAFLRLLHGAHSLSTRHDLDRARLEFETSNFNVAAFAKRFAAIAGKSARVAVSGERGGIDSDEMLLSLSLHSTLPNKAKGVVFQPKWGTPQFLRSPNDPTAEALLGLPDPGEARGHPADGGQDEKRRRVS